MFVIHGNENIIVGFDVADLVRTYVGDLVGYDGGIPVGFGDVGDVDEIGDAGDAGDFVGFSVRVLVWVLVGVLAGVHHWFP